MKKMLISFLPFAAMCACGAGVSAPFRFSIMWNYDARSKVDLDAHAVEPSGTEICFSSHKGSPTDIGGMLDVDMIRPEEKGVENIFWPSLNKLADGEYRLFVRNYDGRTYLYEIGREIRGDVETDGLFYLIHGDVTYTDVALYENRLSVAFEDLPVDWRCPRCKQPKEKINRA